MPASPQGPASRRPSTGDSTGFGPAASSAEASPAPAPRPVQRTDGKKVTLPASGQTGQTGQPGAGAPPVRVARKKFGGTEAQIRGALTFYKYCAWISGSFLLLLVLEMVTRYVFGYDLMAGAKDALTGQDVAIGWLNRHTGNLTGGVNLSTWILIVHGWFYVVYLFSCFRLWLLMRWPLPQLVVMALGGVVPFLSFIVEHRIHRETTAQLASNPQATKRY